MFVSKNYFTQPSQSHLLHTHTHTYYGILLYVCLCVVCVCLSNTGFNFLTTLAEYSNCILGRYRVYRLLWMWREKKAFASMHSLVVDGEDGNERTYHWIQNSIMVCVPFQWWIVVAFCDMEPSRGWGSLFSSFLSVSLSPSPSPLLLHSSLPLWTPNKIDVKIDTTVLLLFCLVFLSPTIVFIRVPCRIYEHPFRTSEIEHIVWPLLLSFSSTIFPSSFS